MLSALFVTAMIVCAVAGIVGASVRYWSKRRSSGDMKLHRLAEGVYQYRGFFSNSAAVLFPSGWVIVDSQVSPIGGERLRRAIKAVADKPVLYVINTHHHGDHLGGNAIFTEAVTVGTEECAKLAIEREEDRVTYANTFGLGFQVIHPNVPPRKTFNGEWSVVVDGKRVIARQVGQAETDDACVVWFPDHGVVCPGDGVATWDYPFLGTPFLDEGLRNNGEWIKFLENVRNLGATILIPGHGPAIVGVERVRARCELLRNLFVDLFSTTAAVLAEFGSNDINRVVDEVNRRLGHYRRNPGLKETTLCQRFAIYRALNSLLPGREGKGWWNDLRPSAVRASNADYIEDAREDFTLSGLNEWIRRWGSKGSRRLDAAIALETALSKTSSPSPDLARAYGELSDLWFEASRRIQPKVEASELWVRARNAARRAIEIEGTQPQAHATQGCLDVLGGLMFAQPLEKPILNLSRAIESGRLSRGQMLKARFFLGKAYQAMGDDRKRDEQFLRLLPPVVGPVVLLVIKPVLLRFP